MRFHSIGTDNLRIGVSTKMASGALDSMVHTAHLIRRYHTYEDNIKYVVLILRHLVAMAIFHWQKKITKN